MLSIRRLLRLKLVNTRLVSDFVKVVEVGPRDGLQNEKKILSTSLKIDLINRLSESGLGVIEVTSFVSAKWIPQMQDNAEVYRGINKKPGITYPVLVPNLKGLESALEAGVKEVAIFAAASETFSRKNINCSIEESLKRFSETMKKSKENNIKVRAYVSCVVGCPYEGEIKSTTVARLSSALLELGCYEISLGDTVGVGTPKKFHLLLREIRNVSSDMKEFAIHCHNTYGQGIANVYASLENDIRIFDSSVAGLGGCPYAAGASGNIATEDLLYLLHGQGMKTGVDLDKIIASGDWISQQLQRDNQSRVGVAMLSKRKH
ncbi:hydroxymethylglutaryl-CoA lyase, mitochondrial [Venturia canescens]|uniref:hydroxymethylglutaryl-CoA lyase, mitochondrial n=1 Tax=Venturia canescens TaxID=32260 RepID=UPI001C9C0FF3|nr:hydroxymethylglutaryl-CoA lyase, mitochondrial [Venturia canescens]